MRFTYDVSGVLEAEVTVLATQERHKMIISDNAGVMTPEQIEQRFAELADLKIHPREQMENRTLVTRAPTACTNSRWATCASTWRHTRPMPLNRPEHPQARTAFAEVLKEIESDSFL